MLKIKKFGLVAFVAISFLFSACGVLNTETASNTKAGDSNSKQAADTNGETISDDNSDKNAGLCQNEYYPVKPEIKRGYKISGSAPASYVLTQTENEESSFSEKRDFASGISMNVNWICTDEGLRNAEYNSNANFSNGSFKMETLESSGITLPKKWEVGKKWTAEYKVNAKLNAGAASGGAKGTIKITNEIVSLDDKVTTPAGDFAAAKVVSNINMNLNISKPINVKMTNWYSPNVGLIKQEVNSPFGGTQTVEYTGEK